MLGIGRAFTVLGGEVVSEVWGLVSAVGAEQTVEGAVVEDGGRSVETGVDKGREGGCWDSTEGDDWSSTEATEFGSTEVIGFASTETTGWKGLIGEEWGLFIFPLKFVQSNHDAFCCS